VGKREEGRGKRDDVLSPTVSTAISSNRG
jgi:hypothetical protein